MCPDCEARRKLARDALVNAKILEAAAHVAKGAAEALGLKQKAGGEELKAKSRSRPYKEAAPPPQPEQER